MICPKCNGERHGGLTPECPNCPTDEALASSDLFAHVRIPVMIDGQRATITGDPQMPQETRDALVALIRAARKLTPEQLDAINETNAELTRPETKP